MSRDEYNYPSPVAREMTLEEKLSRAALDVSNGASKVAEIASRVHDLRQQNSEAAAELATAQESYEAAIREFQTLLEQQGLTMDLPSKPGYR